MAKSAAAVKAANPKADAVASAAPADETPKKPIVSLLANQWKARESGVYFNTHEVVPNAGTPLEHLTAPEFWCNVSQKFRPGDNIWAYPRDGAWVAELIVWEAGQNFANVTFRFAALKPAFTPVAGVDNDFEIGLDPMRGWCVKRRSSGELLKGDLVNAEDARRWIIDQQAVLKR